MSGDRGFRIKERESIICGIADQMVSIVYGDSETPTSDRVVTISDLFAALDNIFIDGFCHTRGEDRTFRLDRIHSVSELPSGSYYFSCVEWLASYGVGVEPYVDGPRTGYRYIGPTL